MLNYEDIHRKKKKNTHWLTIIKHFQSHKSRFEIHLGWKLSWQDDWLTNIDILVGALNYCKTFCKKLDTFILQVHWVPLSINGAKTALRHLENVEFKP